MRKFLSRLFSGSGDATHSDGSVSNNAEMDTGETELVDRSRQWEWDRAGEHPYNHYTDAIGDVKQLKREKRHDEAEEILLWCINFAEAEADAKGHSSLPRGYYRHLAIIYRKDERYEDEVEILERYVANSIDTHEKMANRLERARELATDN